MGKSSSEGKREFKISIVFNLDNTLVKAKANQCPPCCEATKSSGYRLSFSARKYTLPFRKDGRQHCWALALEGQAFCPILHLSFFPDFQLATWLTKTFQLIFPRFLKSCFKNNIINAND